MAILQWTFLDSKLSVKERHWWVGRGHSNGPQRFTLDRMVTLCSTPRRSSGARDYPARQGTCCHGHTLVAPMAPMHAYSRSPRTCWTVPYRNRISGEPTLFALRHAETPAQIRFDPRIQVAIKDCHRVGILEFGPIVFAIRLGMQYVAANRFTTEPDA